jgi:hypothetical protein
MIEGRMRTGFLPALAVLVALVAAGCGGEELIQVPPQNPPHIAVRYLLVAFSGSPPNVAVPAAPGRRTRCRQPVRGGPRRRGSAPDRDLVRQPSRDTPPSRTTA